MNAVITPKGPKQDKRDKYFKLLGLGVLTPDQSKKAEKLAGKILAADAEQAKADAQAQAKKEKARILYEARLEKCEQARAELDDLQPVTTASVKAFDEAIKSAKWLAQQEGYEQAAEALHKVHATNAPEKAVKAWNEAATAAEKFAPKAIEAAKKIDTLLAESTMYLPRSAIVAAKEAKLDAARRLLVPKPPESTINGATKDLVDLHAKLCQDVDAGKDDWTKTEALRAETSRKLNMIAPLSGDQLPLLTDREAAPMRLQLASAATSMSLCEFAEARAVLTPLRDELDDIQTRMGPQRAEWIRREPRLRPLAQECRKFATEALCPKAKADAAALSAELQQLLSQGPGKNGTLSDAVDLVDGAPARMDTLRGLEQSYLLFQRKASGPIPLGPDGKAPRSLEDSKKNIEKLFADVAESLDKMSKAISSATKGAHTKAGQAVFVQRSAALREEWDKRVAAASDPASLDEAGMKAQLQALRKDIDATRRTPVKLKGAIDDELVARAQKTYQDARAKALTACDALLARDAVAGANEVLAINQICAPIAGVAEFATSATMMATYQSVTASLKSKAKRLGEKTTRLQEGVQGKQDELNLKLEELGKKLAEVKALADAAKNAEKQAPLVALFETLQTPLDGLRAMAKLTQLDSLKGAMKDAAKFELELDQSIAAAKGESSDDAMSFAKARKAIADMKVKADEKNCKLYCVVTQDKTSRELKELEEKLGTMTMGELTTRIKELRQAVTDMKKAAEDAKTATETFESTIVKPLRARLDDKAFKDAAEFRTSMKAEIDALVGDFRYEKDGPGLANKKATDIGDKLTAVLQGDKNIAGMPEALAAEQAAAKKAANDKIVDKGKFEGEVEVLEKKLTALKSVNSREIEPLIDLLDSARSTAKKSGDFTSGRDQLVSIRKRMSLVAANPRGLAISARNKLPQVNARVKRAISAYVEALGTVDAEVQKLAAADLDANGKKAVADQLEALRGLFNPGAFEATVNAMAAKGGSREQRSGEREKGLREVRRMQAYLENDVRLRTLRDTPWNKSMPSVLSELNLALLDIENNLLVSI